MVKELFVMKMEIDGRENLLMVLSQEELLFGTIDHIGKAYGKDQEEELRKLSMLNTIQTELLLVKKNYP